MDNTFPFEIQNQPETMKAPFGMRYNEWLAARRELALKKSKAREMVKRIAKNGVNEEQGYSFVEAADVYDLMRPILAECQIGFEVEYVGKRNERFQNGPPITDVDLRVIFTDLETGYFEQKLINATGADYSDKGVYKAYTSGEKYALIMEFMIPTGGDVEGIKPTPNEQEQPQQRCKGASEPPVTPEQIGQIKLKVLQLNQIPGQTVEVRTRGIAATYLSLATRLKLKELNDELLTALTEGQAAEAIANLDEWIEKRKQLEERKGAKTK